jgi:prepilin-type N-terminal cleavage/methylation domain-containing protein/prepilin-type processing-associated H-X9-DG protein
VKKRAFTLIELLVVIAIIAILAAILFPVFAQAKLAAKRAASLSNVKQITLSEIIYQNDYDDNFVLSANDLCNGGCPNTSPYSCVSNLSTPTASWPLILYPYVKTLGIYVDPGTGDPQGIYSAPGVPGTLAEAANNSLPANALTFQNNATQYGYNYEFLSPLKFQTTSDLGNGTLCCLTSTESGLGRSDTAAVNPTATVMFVTTQNFAAPWSNLAQFATPDSSWANAPGVDFSMLPSQDRVFLVGSTCFSTSHDNTKYAGSISLGYCGWAGADAQGPFTADVRALSPYQGSNAGWVDGHAKYATAGQLAVGTDYSVATAASHPDPIYGYNTGCIVNGLVTSGRTQKLGATNALGLSAPTGYVWSLDGTMSDIN